MAEQDALSKFDFSKVTGGGLYLKFEAGKPLTLRVLTTDPVVFTNVFTDKVTGEESVTTRFAFVVYNFTDDKAQILQASPTMAKKIGELHVDPAFGANIKNIDIRISPTGERLQRKYDIQVLPKAQELTKEQIEAAKAIDLDERVDGDRMSLYDPNNVPTIQTEDRDISLAATEKDVVINDIPDDPINLDDIPFS